MIIEDILGLRDVSKQGKKLIPKHQAGGKTEEEDIKRMSKSTAMVAPAHFAEGTTPDQSKRLYRVGTTGTGTLVSVPKADESIRGALLSRLKEQHNLTANKINKERLQKLMSVVSQVKNPSNLRGNEEVDMYKKIHPDLSDFIENVGFGAAAMKRGIDLSIPSREASASSDTTASPLLTRLKRGGKIEGKKEDKKEDKPKLVMKKGGKKWIQKAVKSIKKRGTKGVCTGAKFGSSSCPAGSKRYNLAKTFKKMAKK